MNLIMFCYNFVRTKNILGFHKMLKAIKSWNPDYNKVICAIKKVLYNQNQTTCFLKHCIPYFYTGFLAGSYCV